VTSSSAGWSLGDSSLWTYDSVVLSHILLSGLLVLSSSWHWNYAELDVFVSQASGRLVLDLPRVFGIHLSLAGFPCRLYGVCHLAGGFGHGRW
jgi:photosystem II CP47 chlorophyll apoprotein